MNHFIEKFTDCLRWSILVIALIAYRKLTFEWVEHLRVKLCYKPKVCLKIKAYFDKEETGMQLYPRQFINEIPVVHFK